MKDYINVFHAIVSDIHFWDNLEDIKKRAKINDPLGKKRGSIVGK